MDYHELANLFPVMSAAEAHSLKEDMRQNGYRTDCPIILYEGQILDGRNRYIAATELGIEPVFTQYTGDNALAYVISLNLNRRHLNESQRAVIAARLANMRQGERTDIEPNLNLDKVSQREAAAMLNVSRASVANVKAIEREDPDLLSRIEAGNLTVSKAMTTIKRKERIANIRQSEIQPLGEIQKRYGVVYADPAWQYEHDVTPNRSIENQYPTMPLEEICALPVKDIGADSGMLFLWATTATLEQAFSVIKAWGYEYRTSIIWDKEMIGMGYFTRVQHEFLLIAIRGDVPIPEPPNRPASVYRESRGEHSKKPDYFYTMIETMYPELGKIELFARQRRDGWDAWGYEANG